MDAVAPLRHVGRGAALKISIAELRNFLQECDAQPRFEPPAEPERACRDRKLEQQQHADKARERGGRERALSAEREMRADRKKAAKEQRLAHDAKRGNSQRNNKSSGSEQTLAAQQAEQCPPGPNGWLFERSHELWR